ncbi:hypothetical protein M501DRAFT_991030 [Patellaria atrata CBS 101060]|uniref:Peptidase A1 domain-containing protein n=1 Tax=Patellaria atrata CBS 101060 TaxID=1346257 RepID=A0A9P4S2Z6_9PEZI|nr:hypothetical protein M501DRAFT_991030 [Patellaria atrata CBS 101060]
MGKIGLSSREAINSSDWSTPKDEEITGPIPISLLGGLMDSGISSTASYSIWLNHRNASTGSILFGGMDTEKFSGKLHALPTRETLGSKLCGTRCRNMISIEDVYLESGVDGPAMRVNDSVTLNWGIDALLQPSKPFSSLPGNFGSIFDSLMLDEGINYEVDTLNTVDSESGSSGRRSNILPISDDILREHSDNSEACMSVLHSTGMENVSDPATEDASDPMLSRNGIAGLFVDIAVGTAIFVLLFTFLVRRKKRKDIKDSGFSKPELEAKELQNHVLEASGEA